MRHLFASACQRGTIIDNLLLPSYQVTTPASKDPRMSELWVGGNVVETVGATNDDDCQDSPAREPPLGVRVDPTEPIQDSRPHDVRTSRSPASVARPPGTPGERGERCPG
jgi:hypothetical protein